MTLTSASSHADRPGSDVEHRTNDLSYTGRSVQEHAVHEQGVRCERGLRYSAVDLADLLGLPRPTPEQRAVIEGAMAPTLVVAGAGSGKTETMTARVVWLVSNGLVEADEVLGLTFTRKAAGELAERLERRLARLARVGVVPDLLDQQPEVSTYHSFAGRLLAEEGARIGLDCDSRLLSEASAWQYAHEVVTRWEGPMHDVEAAESTVTHAVLALAGELSEHLRDVTEVQASLDDLTERIETLPKGASRAKGLPREVAALVGRLRARRQILPLVAAYQQLKRSRGSLDFADQVALSARLVREHPCVATSERSRWRVVLLDEVQDTSDAQLALLQGVFVDSAGGAPVPVTAVGDPHQSIYGWRGASATTLRRFGADFAGAGETVVLPLSTSWRNDQTILDVANVTATELRQDSAVPVARLVARPGAGVGAVHTARLDTERAEAAYVAEWLAERRGGNGEPVRSAAVLCRRRSQFPALVAALRARQVPVDVVGLGGLLADHDVADVVALLHVAVHPDRVDALMRLLTGPAVRLGIADLDGLAAWARHITAPDDCVRGSSASSADPVPAKTPSAPSVGLVEALDRLPGPTWRGEEGEWIGATAHTRLSWLSRQIRWLRSELGRPLTELIDLAEAALGLDVEVAARAPEAAVSARSHLDAFARIAQHFEGSADRATMAAFLDWLDVARREERGLDTPVAAADRAAVQVLTVHAAKGLEWDLVAVPGLVEGVFPAYSTGPTRPVDGDWHVSDIKDKGWIGNLDALPYELRGDAAGLPRLNWRTCPDLSELNTELQRFAVAGGVHRLSEERKLAYVAVTRARQQLLLSAPVWTDGSTPRVTSRLLTEIMETPGVHTVQGPWQPMPEPIDGAVVPPESCGPRTATWPANSDEGSLGPDQRAAERVNSLIADGATVAARLPARGGGTPGDPASDLAFLLAERHAIRRSGETNHAAVEVGLPGHLSASSLQTLLQDPSGFADTLRRPMPGPPDPATRTGSVFHAWVERHYQDATLFEQLEEPNLGDRSLSPDTRQSRLRENFLRSSFASMRPVFTELPVETALAGCVIRGRIDAVFRTADGGYLLVDWKAGKPATGSRATTHAVQLAVYRVAFARWLQIDPDTVGTACFYAETGKTVYPQRIEQGPLERLVVDALTESNGPGQLPGLRS